MLSMSNVAVLTGIEAANKQKQDILTNLENKVSKLELEKSEQYAALMNDIAAHKAQVIEINGKYDREVAAHGKARRTVEILGKDNASLRAEVNKLKEEQMASKDDTEKLIQEIKAEFERQINERVEQEYSKAHGEGYDDCMHDHGFIVTDRLCSNPASPDENYGRVSRGDIATPVVEGSTLENLPLGGSNLGETFSTTPAPIVVVNIEDESDTAAIELNKKSDQGVVQEDSIQACGQVDLVFTGEDTRDVTSHTSDPVESVVVRDSDARDKVTEPNAEEALSLPPLAMLPPQ